MSRTLTLSLLATACLCAAPQVLAQGQDRGSAQETQQSREQAAREQAAREQAARDQQAREQAARQKQQQEQQRIENARQEQQRIGNARADEASQKSANHQALFRKFKVEESLHRERVARIAALRRLSNARQNEARVAELDQLLARENERYGEWIRRTRNELGEEEFENQRARIDGRAVRPAQPPAQRPARPQ